MLLIVGIIGLLVLTLMWYMMDLAKRMEYVHQRSNECVTVEELEVWHKSKKPLQQIHDEHLERYGRKGDSGDGDDHAAGSADIPRNT